MNASTQFQPHPAADKTSVCLLTARGPSAIAAIALTGPDAAAIIERLSGKPAPAPGRCRYGMLRANGRVLDSVIIAAEAPRRYVILCHGNPLLAERIVRLCQDLNAVPICAEEFAAGLFEADAHTRIESEARLTMTQAVTLEGVELLAAQIDGGLTGWTRGWMACRPFHLDKVTAECKIVLDRSIIAARLLHGVRIALVGAPNSGKSTLLNRLSGDRTALVTDTAGTTRDWVATTCRIGPLRVELIDTAGLDAQLAEKSELDRAAQAAAVDAVKTADLLLHICDCTQMNRSKLPHFNNIPALTVYTKSDLLTKPEAFRPDTSEPSVLVSAKADYGLETLCRGILSTLSVDTLRPDEPICFTSRQRTILSSLAAAESEASARQSLAALLGQKHKTD